MWKLPQDSLQKRKVGQSHNFMYLLLLSRGECLYLFILKINTAVALIIYFYIDNMVITSNPICTADPEEFLNILFHHILRVDPLLKLR